jgi:hypothetical protein
LGLINAVRQGIAEKSQQSANADIPYQGWIVDEADKAISNTTVAITSARDGIALTNYCTTFTRPDIFHKYETT